MNNITPSLETTLYVAVCWYRKKSGGVGTTLARLGPFSSRVQVVQATHTQLDPSQVPTPTAEPLV